MIGASSTLAQQEAVMSEVHSPRRRRRVGLGVRGLLAVGCVAALVAGCASNTKKTDVSGPSTSTRNGSGQTSTSTTGPDAGATLISGVKQPGVEHLKFKYGPIAIQPGQNNIVLSGTNVPKP